MARLWKSSLTPWCLLPPLVHVLLCGLCGWKVRPLWPSSALHCGRNLFFLLDGRGTDEPKPPIRHPLRMVWVAQTPHPSSVTDGIGKWPGQPSHGQTVTVTQKRIGLLWGFGEKWKGELQDSKSRMPRFKCCGCSCFTVHYAGVHRATTATDSQFITLQCTETQTVDLTNKVGGNHYLRHVDHRSTLHGHEQDWIFHIHVRGKKNGSWVNLKGGGQLASKTGDGE